MSLKRHKLLRTLVLFSLNESFKVKRFKIIETRQKNEPWKLVIFYTDFEMSSYRKIKYVPWQSLIMLYAPFY